ncbi:MAG: acetyl-CoA carboxylase carboxyltransferase subunit alpha [Acidobacteriota bacterium]
MLLETKVQEINQLKERVQSLPPEAAEIQSLKEKIAQLEDQVRQHSSAWDHVQLSRHPERPYTLDYIARMFTRFRQIQGDRKYADDAAIVGGMALLDGQPVMVLGHQKGRNTKERIFRNYGMPKPEGYRKAIRLMRLAEKFSRPIFTFIDTPGAYPGIGAEKRGQAQAIASNLKAMARIQVPIIVTVLGEGGSGGALAIGVGDWVAMLEHSIYSVISPESCSAILWKDQDHARQAAENLKLTAENLYRFGIIDEIVPEPAGGAQNNYDQTAQTLKESLLRSLEKFRNLTPPQLQEARFARFRRMGTFIG